MICGLAMEAIALGWLAAAVTPTVSYGLLVPALVLAGDGERAVLRARGERDAVGRRAGGARSGVRRGHRDS